MFVDKSVMEQKVEGKEETLEVGNTVRIASDFGQIPML
jgi:hypothetical protein